MIKGASGYNPATLFRAKREKQRAQIEQAKSQKVAPVSKNESAAPEEDHGIFKEAMSLLKVAKPSVKSMNEKIEEMKKLANASLNTQLSDEDRKQINKKFLLLRSEIDSVAKGTEFNGQKIFTGDLEDIPIKLKVGTESREVVEIRFESLMNEDTGIEGLKVDTLVNARKASKELEESSRKYQLAVVTLKTKEDIILAKKRIYDELLGTTKEEKSGDSKGSGKTSTEEKLRMNLFSDLRERQKQLSNIEGREVALLVNKRA